MTKTVLLKRIGQRIVNLRTERNLSQADLANLAGKDRQSIHRVEKGEINVSVHYLYEIAEALKIKLSDLITIDK
jgi:putative transcriptional regulator